MPTWVQPLQKIILVSEVRDGCIIVRTHPARAVRALALGGVDFSRMNREEKQAFFAQLTSAMLTWDFPFQWAIFRRYQDLSPFFSSMEEDARRAGTEGLAQELLSFVRLVQSQTRALTPHYYMILWEPVGLRPWEKVVQTLEENVDKAKHTLKSMGVSAVEIPPEELLKLYSDVLSTMPPSIYHPPISLLSPISRTKVVP